MKTPEERLLSQHRLQLGLYERVAKKLDASPAYVILVAHGKRRSEKVMAALIREIRRIESR